MNEYQIDFFARLKRLEATRQPAERSLLGRMLPAGLIAAMKRPASWRITTRLAAIILMTFFVFKGGLMAGLGEDSYRDAVARSQNGVLIERGGALLMQVDPLSRWIGRSIRMVAG